MRIDTYYDYCVDEHISTIFMCIVWTTLLEINGFIIITN